MDINIRWMMAVMILLTCTCTLVNAQSYPEYTGNYYQCDDDWCEIKHHQLNTMQLLISNRSGRQTVGYGGYFEIQEAVPTIKTKKPKFLFYMGRENVDPRYTALVELEPMPYNNAPIAVIDGTDYNLKRAYTSSTTNQLWTFKREVQIRFKPIQGKVGMFIIEPSESLTEGFYAIDYGVPQKSGHSGLRTAPEAMGFQKTLNVQTAIPFVIGDKNQIASQSISNQRSDNSVSASNGQQQRPEVTIDVVEAVGGLLKGLFGGN